MRSKRASFRQDQVDAMFSMLHARLAARSGGAKRVVLLLEAEA
jgi:hypothetical protein